MIGFRPPINRQLYHDFVDREQKNALKLDGRADNLLYVMEDDEVNYMVTYAVTQKIDVLQYRIEKDSVTNHAKKVTYIRGLENLLRNFNAGIRSRKFNASNFPLVIDAYEASMKKDSRGESIETVIGKANYQVARLLLDSKAFEGNAGFKVSRHAMVRKYAQLHPDQVFLTLKDNLDVPFRDSLIKATAHKYPDQLYNWAAANNPLGRAIRSIDDPLVKTVSRMSSSTSGQMYFPFLDNILNGKQTLEEIDAVKNDQVKYYKLLVKTRQDYLARMLNKDTIYQMNGLEKRLEIKAKEVFIKPINDLHEEPDAVRFRILQQLSAPELYYLTIYGESDIYTSSYVNGVYPLLMQKIGNRGDSLLMTMQFDRFKKFIKMAAGFNTLDNFLKTFRDPKQAESLMTAFVNGLEKSSGLEDGVDVADSYVSISEGNKELANYMLQLTKQNYEKNQATNNQRGMIMYNLLYKLFLSADSTRSIDLTQEFGIPPVYSVPFQSLASDSSHRVIMQVYFYGDKDGKMAYNNYVSEFNNGNWKRSETKQWVTFASTKGKPVLIFANKPLPEETNEDAEAQEALNQYLAKEDLQPTIVVHRGHSYYAPYTIKQIQPSAKIVFLGSCGGYHLINSVLQNAPDAHIIASKQIGKMVINQPFFNILMEKLRVGNNIDWIPFWKEFRRDAGSTEGFDDYIPPHKNLGAIFIKAYKNQMGGDDES